MKNSNSKKNANPESLDRIEWYKKSIEDTLLLLSSEPSGLSDQEASDRLKTNRTAKRVAVFVFALSIFVFVIGVLAKESYYNMFMYSISIAVAAVPEGFIKRRYAG